MWERGRNSRGQRTVNAAVEPVEFWAHKLPYEQMAEDGTHRWRWSLTKVSILHDVRRTGRSTSYSSSSSIMYA